MNHPETRRDDLPDTEWASSALCADMPTEIFDGTTVRLQTAKAACAHCTVARQCLRWALTTEIEDEIWGGRTPAERRRLSIAFVLDPPTIRSPPDLSQPVEEAVPEGPSEVRAERPRGVRQGARPKKTSVSSRASTEVAVRSPKTRSSAPAECGTEAGYKRHRRHDEPTCEDCRRAVRDAQTDRAARHAAGTPVATRAKVAPCGTPAGYARHRNKGEDACDRCTAANRNYLQAHRAHTRIAAS